MQGTVKKIFADDFTGKFGPTKRYSVLLTDGTKLSGGFGKKFEAMGIAEGATYNFTIESKGGYQNITSVSAGMADAPQTGGAAPVASGIAVPRDRAIIKQNALTNAVNYMTCFNEGEEVPPSAVIQVAMQFEAYTSGELEEQFEKELTEGSVEEAE